MKKENIVMSQMVVLEITSKVLNYLDKSLLKENIGIQIQEKNTPTQDEKEDFYATLMDFSPPVVLAIMRNSSSIALWDLKRRALAYRWFQNLPLRCRQDLYEAWYLLKFLCQEIQNPTARTLGKSMADLSHDVDVEVLEKYRRDILEILENPSAPNRIRNSLWKNYTHQVKKSGEVKIEIKDPNDPTSLETLIHELRMLEDDAIDSNIFFGTSPIIYKSTTQDCIF